MISKCRYYDDRRPREQWLEVDDYFRRQDAARMAAALSPESEARKRAESEAGWARVNAEVAKRMGWKRDV